MKTKHKILEELYQVQLVNKNSNVTLVDVSLNIDELRKRIKSKEQDFHSSLEVLYANNEIHIAINKNIASITQKGILSLNNKKYLKEHYSFLSEKFNPYLKIGTFILALIGLVLTFRSCF